MVWSLNVCGQSAAKLVVFGDSLSDTGNSYEYSHHTKPPDKDYYQGRFSNGPIWIDYVANSWFPNHAKPKVINYAFGGAGVLVTQENAFLLRQEIDGYLLTHRAPLVTNDWFVIWIGANDYLLNPLNHQGRVTKVVAEVRRNLLRLKKQGARHLVVLSLPDLGLTPYAHDLDLQPQLSQITKLHNHLLRTSLVKLQRRFPEMDWIYMDVNQTLQALMKYPQQYGFANLTERCLNPQLNPSSDPHAKLRFSDTVLNFMTHKKCKDYLFLDQIHPTTRVHQLLAYQFINIPKINPR